MQPLPGDVWMVRDADFARTDDPQVFLDPGSLVLVIASPADGYVLCVPLNDGGPRLHRVVERHLIERVSP